MPFLKDHSKAQLVYLSLMIYLISKISNDKIFNRNNRNLNSKSNEFNKSSTFWIFLITLLIKPECIPLIPIQLYLEDQINLICQNESKRVDRISYTFRILIYIYLGMCSFVNLGNTNSLSTLDVSAGFIGLSEYNLALVSTQMICSIYSTIVFWLIQLIDRFKQMQLSNKQKSLILIFIFTIRLLFLIYYQIVAFILMNHIFVWSVITPKLLYEFALTELFELVLIYAIFII